MAQKFIRLSTGNLAELEALVVSTGAGDAGKIPGLDAGGKLDQSMMPVGIGPDIKVLTASENLSAGDKVNVWNDAGTVKVRKADATTAGKQADGFVLAAVNLGNPATVYFGGVNNQKTALTLGATYFLSTTPGGIVTAPPAGAGNIVQKVGIAVSATELALEPGEPITLA